MNSAIDRSAQALATRVWSDDSMLYVLLVDGREIGAPLEWFPRLREATGDQREERRLIGNGVGVRWPDLDEDISIVGLFTS